MKNELKLRSLEELEEMLEKAKNHDIFKNGVKPLMDIATIFAEEGDKVNTLISNIREACDILCGCSLDNTRDIIIAQGCDKTINDIAKIILGNDYKEFSVIEEGGIDKTIKVVKKLGDRSDAMLSMANKFENIIISNAFIGNIFAGEMIKLRKARV